jgi:perosamine synthetase
LPRHEIPLFRVRTPDKVCEALQPVFDGGFLADGEKVVEFAQLIATYVGNPNVVMVSDVSAGITLALYVAGVRPGDDVIVSPMCCTATTMPIANLFARPVWCDVDPSTGMIDPQKISGLISQRTKAILFTHWGGDVAESEAVRAIAHEHGLRTVEDAAEAFGAEVGGRHLGNDTADFTVYSFYPTKHLTTGEGGAIFCTSFQDAKRVEYLKRYGIHKATFRLPDGDLNPESDIPEAGYSFPMNNIAAAIGVEQMRTVVDTVARHQENGRFFDEALAGVPGLTLLRRRNDARSAHWVYTVLAERRDDLKVALRERGIIAQRLHLRNDRYSCFPPSAMPLPGVDTFDRQALAIPCGWWVNEHDRDYTADVVRRLMDRLAGSL